MENNIGDVYHVGKISTKKAATLKKIWLIIGVIALLVLCFLIISLIDFDLWANMGSVKITDIRITTEIDQDGDLPPPKQIVELGQPRVYCYIQVEAPKAVKITAKWYFGEDLILEDQALVDSWRAFYIEPLPGKTFPEGKYRVDIFLYDEFARSAYFEVR